MSNKNTIVHTAAALIEMEKALSAIRQQYAETASTARLEAKIAAFAEVVRNTRRKMDRPAGFDWALHRSFKVVGINRTHITVQAPKGRGNECVLLDIPLSDLSLSTWQVTSTIRRLSGERLLADLNASVAEKRETMVQARKEVDAAQERLERSRRDLVESEDAVKRRQARMRSVEAKRAAARARRTAPEPQPVAAQ